MSTSGRKHHKTSVQNIPAGGHIVHRNSSGFGHVILSRVVCCQLTSSVCRRAARNPADGALRSANDRTTVISPSSTHSKTCTNKLSHSHDFGCRSITACGFTPFHSGVGGYTSCHSISGFSVLPGREAKGCHPTVHPGKPRPQLISCWPSA